MDNSAEPPDRRRTRGTWLTKGRAVLAVSAVSVIVGVAVLTIGLLDLFGGDTADDPAPGLALPGAPRPGFVIEAQGLDSQGPTGPGTLRLADSIVYYNLPPVYEMTIDAIDVNAPVLKLWADSEGIPLTPNSANNLAWYNFSARPGSGGNAVFAGHVTWAGNPAVFARLDDLKDGDIISLQSPDGDELVYEIFTTFTIDPNDPNSLQVMAPTKTDTITLITCGGTWVSDPSSEPYGGDFTERTVVQAHLVKPAAAVPTTPHG